MDHTFDKNYWDEIWSGDRRNAMSSSPPNPHLVREVAGLTPGTALDAGCGAGAEAIWLAGAGWEVTAADLTLAALEVGEQRAAEAGVPGAIRWEHADLSTWDPGQQFDLVTTHYAHPAIPQLDFYSRLATWVAPRGTLLVVGHLHHDEAGSPGREHVHGHGHRHGHGHGGAGAPPSEASATPGAITDLLDPGSWVIETAEESQRIVPGPAGRARTLHDVVVRATRLP